MECIQLVIFNCIPLSLSLSMSLQYFLELGFGKENMKSSWRNFECPLDWVAKHFWRDISRAVTSLQFELLLSKVVVVGKKG